MSRLIQRACDSWQSIIGSTALAVLNAFFDSLEEYKQNEQCQTFAEDALKNFAFLYHDTSSV